MSGDIAIDTAKDRPPGTTVGERHSVSGTHPRHGDVVVAREDTGAVLRYTVRQFDGVAQFSCDSLERALSAAGAFARSHNVEIWEEHRGQFRSIAPRSLGGR